MSLPTPRITLTIGHIIRDRPLIAMLSESAVDHGATLVGCYVPATRDRPPALASCADCDLPTLFARHLFETLCQRAGLRDYVWRGRLDAGWV